MSSVETFVDHVAGHTGVSQAQAEVVTRTVLHGIGAYLTTEQCAFVAQELPPTLAHSLGRVDLAEQLAEMRELPELSPDLHGGHPRELVGGVCHVLAEELSAEALQVLRSALPADIAELLESSPEITHQASSPGLRSL